MTGRMIVSFPDDTDRFRESLLRFSIHEDDRLVFEDVLMQLELDWFEFGDVWRNESGLIEIDEDGRIRTFKCPSGVTSVPPSLTRLRSLQDLDLSGTWFLTNLPRDIGNLGTLIKLKISKTGVTSIPRSIGQLQALQELYIHAERPRRLPGEIGNLINLIKLSLEESGVRSLPHSIGQLQSLQELDLSATKIRNLPDEIGNLGNLIKLILAKSRVTSLPSSIGKLQKLQELDLLGAKHFTYLPDEIGNLGNLIKLNLNGSGVTSLPPSIGQLKSLQELDIGIQKLENIPEEFGDLSNLIKLRLFHSRHWVLPSSIEYALACSRYSSRIGMNPIRNHFASSREWPTILGNATHAFRAHCDPPENEFWCILRGLEPHDAIYRFLIDYRESFVEMLINHNKHKD
eukprot:CAMPEP_0197283716 /NCGR_PEP_ID=MMETSP1432-20130617/25075_1 /TAXON_ID=44447 /ORGANISM="Pseudo-nitzschia delicatissima, Strain UNC1205" /LENGTH=400 /DNA_ID=CAMNT_0042750709 /DNA_START=66 /DNA_END=1268 /DNA_ORIENTATION=-